LKIAAGVLGLLSVGLLAATVTLGVLYADAKNDTTTTTSTTTSTLFSSPGALAVSGPNPCNASDPGLANIDCYVNGVRQALEQAGANVTLGYEGLLNTSAAPVTSSYYQAGLCPVNVHWHLGTEHLSVGQYDEQGTGPTSAYARRKANRRLRAGAVTGGYQCRHYDATDSKFTTAYDWKYCQNMEVGQTYEVHWPHSAAGACGTPYQYQFPFYDGVFCRWGTVGNSTNQQIGVQAQVFTIVNDESYYYPNLIDGMIVDGTRGADMTIYTGSTTGSSRSNTICSQYTPITWQVDRTCHLISASSFDKMCADMSSQYDDMSGDLYPHGSRVLVESNLTANNQVDADHVANPEHTP
jgi:hypothetical protein